MIKYNFIENFQRVEIKSKIDTTITEINSDNSNTFTFKSTYFPQYSETFLTSIKAIPATWKEVYDVDLETKQVYEPCDSIGLLVPNPDIEVDKLIDLCSLSKEANKMFKIERIGFQSFEYCGTLRDFIKYRMDITSIPRKKALFELAKNCTKKRELEFFCSKEGNQSYLTLIKNRNDLNEIIEEFGCKPTVSDLISSCEILKPRYYSMIQSSGSSVKILIGIIVNTVDDKLIYGHVSKFIKNQFNLLENETCRIPVEMCLRKNQIYKNMTSSTLICFCSGTGIAPFLSFYKLKKFKNLKLIYGFRNLNDNLSKYYNIEQDGVILAQSSENKRVYDFIDSIGEFSEDCNVFICGNAKMQRDVFNEIKVKYPALVEDKKVFFDSWA